MNVIGSCDARVRRVQTTAMVLSNPAKFSLNELWRSARVFGMVSKHWHPRFVVDSTGHGCADIIWFGESSTFGSSTESLLRIFQWIKVGGGHDCALAGQLGLGASTSVGIPNLNSSITRRSPFLVLMIITMIYLL